MSDKTLAEFLKRASEECKDHEPSMVLSVSTEGNCVELLLDSGCNRWHLEWIPGEGGDIGLFRDTGTNRIVGVRLPLKKRGLRVFIDEFKPHAGILSFDGEKS